MKEDFGDRFMKKKELITEDDREVVMELARKYLRDDKHAAIQRWAWEKVLPYALPRLASSELKTGDGEGFKIVVEDYRNLGVQEAADEVEEMKQ